MFLNEQETPLAVHWRIVALSFVGWLTVFTSLMLYVSMAGRYRVDLDLGDAEVAWVKSLVLGATGVGGLLLGAFGDRFGRRTAILTSLGVLAVGLVLSSFAKSLETLAMAAGLAGLGIGGQWAAGQTLVGETVPPALRARFGMISQSGAPLGLIASTLISQHLADRLGWRGTLVSVAGFAVLLVLSFGRLVPESDLWLAQRGKASDRTRGTGGIRSLLAPDVRRSFGLAFLLTVLCMASYWFTVTWLREYMGRTWKLSEAQSGTWFLAFAAGSLLGYGLFALTATWLGRRPAFSIFCGLSAAGTILLTVCEEAIRTTPSLVLAFAGLTGIGTGIWSSFGPLYTEIFPTRVRTTAGGVCMNVSRGVQFLAPHLVPWIGGEELRSGILLAAGFSALAGVVIWGFPDTRGLRLEAPRALPDVTPKNPASAH